MAKLGEKRQQDIMSQRLSSPQAQDVAFRMDETVCSSFLSNYFSLYYYLFIILLCMNIFC